MIKKYFLLFLFIFVALCTFATDMDYAHLAGYDDMDKNFFEKLVFNEEATYMICTGEDSRQYASEEKARKIFLKSLNNWRERTKNFIVKNGIPGELDDILQMMEREPKLREIPCSETKNADLTVYFTKDNQHCGANTVGCYKLYEGVIYLKVFFGARHVNILTHEIGHAFGLADSYRGTLTDGSYVYNSKVKRPSIFNTKSKVTCDDADGLITSIDRVKGHSRTFHSLCKDGLLIRNGEGVIAADESYSFSENYEPFNAEVAVSYDTKVNDTYTADITLQKFILDRDYSIYILRGMGFDVRGLNAVRHAVVKIHGTLKERLTPSEDEERVNPRTPMGLWTFVLYEENGRNLEEKQIVTKDFSEEDQAVQLEILDTGDSFFSKQELMIPLVNMFYKVGYGEKEILRMKNIFRSDLERAERQIQESNNAALGAAAAPDMTSPFKGI